MDHAQTPSPRYGWLTAHGALLAAASIILLAYASHASWGVAQARLQSAGILAFGHGIALAALTPAAQRRLPRLAMLALYVGALLFSGSLVFNVIAHWPTTLAPLGGVLLIGGWLLWAVDALKH